jgi:prepilin-type N-terminal cleavage/methylation domain-containing protein
MWLIGSSYSTEYERGFTFVELMITVVILLVGLVAIIQGFIIATGALNTAKNHILLVPFLETKMQDIEAASRREDGLKKIDSKGEFSFDARNFAWNFTLGEIQNNNTADLNEELKEAKLEVSWQERNQPRNLSLVTYLKNKKK